MLAYSPRLANRRYHRFRTFGAPYFVSFASRFFMPEINWRGVRRFLIALRSPRICASLLIFIRPIRPYWTDGRGQSLKPLKTISVTLGAALVSVKNSEYTRVAGITYGTANGND